jgi:hypothetical protein
VVIYDSVFVKTALQKVCSMDMGHTGRRLRRGGLFGVEGLGLGFVRGLRRKRVLI